MWPTSIGCVTSLTFINLLWLHGIVKSIICTLQNLSGEVGHHVLFTYSFMSTVNSEKYWTYFRYILHVVCNESMFSILWYRYYLVGKYAISNAVSADGRTCLDIDLDIGHTCLDVYTSPSCSLIVLMTVEIHHLVINDSIFYRTSEINRNMSDLLY